MFPTLKEKEQRWVVKYETHDFFQPKNAPFHGIAESKAMNLQKQNSAEPLETLEEDHLPIFDSHTRGIQKKM